MRFRLALALVLGLTRLAPAEPEPHRSPIALALSPDGSRLLTANQTSGTVSLVDPVAGRVLHEIATGDKPAGVAFAPDGRRAAVTHWYGYDVAVLGIDGDRLSVVGRVPVGPEPRGIAIAPDGKSAYVAVGVANEVVRVDLEKLEVSGRLPVGREPRGLALTPDGKKLVVGNSREGTLAVVDTGEWKVLNSTEIQGSNLRQVIVSKDGTTGYVANMRNRGFATTSQNIDIGWVLGQRATRIKLDGSRPFETLTLDPQGKAASDVHGIALNPAETLLAVASGGTHEILLFRTDLAPLPWRDRSSRDLMADDLVRDQQRFRRIAVGGRPTELAFAPDGKHLYVANYLADAVQVVDAEQGTVASAIALGSPSELGPERRGEVLFHEAARSFNQWYSCNTCHPDGHTGGENYDTMNDGWHDYSALHKDSKKKVPSLRRVAETGPWTWHGWQESLEAATIESFTKSMQGAKPKPEEVRDLVAFLKTLDYPANPNRAPDGGLTPAAERGREVFRSSKAACSSCHGGPEFTDGEIHSVGLEEPRDVYKGYNPPSLRGLYDKDPYLHDGRAKDLRGALTGAHNPEEVTGLGSLTDQELNDLIEFLKAL
jgi:YVTN family beta-propeller protein